MKIKEFIKKIPLLKKTVYFLRKAKTRAKNYLFVRGNVFMLHRVFPKEENSLPANENMKVYPKNLDAFLAAIKKKYKVIFASEVSKYSRRFHFKKFAAFTFDDGYKDNFTRALPIFKKHGLPFSIFVTASFPEKNAVMWWYALEELILQNKKIVFGEKTYECESAEQKQKVFLEIRLKILALDQNNLKAALEQKFCHYKIDWEKYPKTLALSWNEVQELFKEPLVELGSHTYSHKNLKALSSLSEVEDEIKAGAKSLMEHGIKAQIFAYPFGTENEVSAREINFLKKNPFGIKCAFLAGGQLCLLRNMKFRAFF